MAIYRRYNFKNIIVLLILFIILALIIRPINEKINCLWPVKPKEATEMIDELPKIYKSYINILNKNINIRGMVDRTEDQTTIEVMEPALLIGIKITYYNDKTKGENKIKMEYKGIEIKSEDNFILEKLSLTTFNKIENMVYNKEYEDWEVKDDSLFIFGEYYGTPFVVESNLRTNKIISINMEDKGFFATYS